MVFYSYRMRIYCGIFKSELCFMGRRDIEKGGKDLDPKQSIVVQ